MGTDARKPLSSWTWGLSEADVGIDGVVWEVTVMSTHITSGGNQGGRSRISWND